MGAVFLDGLELAGFETIRQWIENAFGIAFPEPRHRLYYLAKIAGISALWLLIAAFWVQPLRTCLRFDLVEFKKLLGAFTIGYALLHLILFVASHRFSLPALGELFVSHLFLGVGFAALLVIAITPHVKAWYKLLYIGVVLVIVHLLLGYRELTTPHILAITLLSLGLALRLIKR
jgi:DMSO/TMAO reductase YedYZ heme-binding membrane subunit